MARQMTDTCCQLIWPCRSAAKVRGRRSNHPTKQASWGPRWELAGGADLGVGGVVGQVQLVLQPAGAVGGEIGRRLPLTAIERSQPAGAHGLRSTLHAAEPGDVTAQ